jgi:2'-5' RNA ligase
MPASQSERVQKYRDLIPVYSTFKTPLHITIIPPFYLESTEKNLVDILKKNISVLPSATITLDSIAYFEHRSSVVYLKPDISSETYLKKLFAAIPFILKDTIKRQFNKSSNPDDFHPHLTIAKRIPLNKLYPIKGIFQSFNDVFTFNVTAIDIYRQPHSYGPWTKIAEISLSAIPAEQTE